MLGCCCKVSMGKLRKAAVPAKRASYVCIIHLQMKTILTTLSTDAVNTTVLTANSYNCKL